MGGKHSVKLYKRLGKSCVYIDTCINVYSCGNLPIIIVSRLLPKCNKARRCAKSNPLLKFISVLVLKIKNNLSKVSLQKNHISWQITATIFIYVKE